MQYVILDFETTGLNPAQDEIIEIAALKMDDFKITERFETLVRPQAPIPPAITQLTGISPSMVQSAPSLEELVDEMIEFLGDLPIVAHNASMEQGFLDEHIRKGFRVQDSIEPIALSRPELGRYSMESLRNDYQLSTEGSHRAGKDCEDLAQILQKVQEFLFRERPQIADIVRDQLVPASHPELWWWRWFFKTDDPKHAPQFTPPQLGNLNQFRTEDSKREIDWSVQVNAREIQEVLGDRVLEKGLEPRDSQLILATEVLDALQEGKKVAIEAPTGVGKSLGYLVPGVLHAQKSGAPLVVSTHSKSLQDQLLFKDVPILSELLDEEIKATAVKGQENYLCLRKLNEYLEDAALEDQIPGPRLASTYLLAFASITPTVELNRVSRYLTWVFPPLRNALDAVRSHHTTTIGPKCPFYDRCHFYNSARLAHQSDVIIANHSLTFQWPQHLPQIRNIVFDEGHHLEDQITQAFSVELQESDILQYTDRLSGKSGKRKSKEWKTMVRFMDQLQIPAAAKGPGIQASLEEMTEALRHRLSELHEGVPKQNPNGFEVAYPIHSHLEEALKNLLGEVKRTKEFLEVCIQASPTPKGANKEELKGYDTLARYYTRFEHYQGALEVILDSENINLLRLLIWNPKQNSWRTLAQPIQVSELSAPIFDSKRSVVVTSATLTNAANPKFVIDRVGLKLSQDLLQLPSPYEIKSQAQIFIPTELPLPGTRDHLNELIQFTTEAAKRLGGKTLLLITSNARLRVAVEELRENLKDENIAVIDGASDTRAGEHFRQMERAILVGSEKYGEGLDIPGDALSLVIIEKINEAMTRGPLAEARKAQTDFAIYDYDFPLRTMWLKQRVGRLIRSQTDKGSVVIFDPRFHKWGKRSQEMVSRSLSPMPLKVGSVDEVLDQIESFAELNGGQAPRPGSLQPSCP